MSNKVRVALYDPDQRAIEKALSRRLDEEALNSGRISREEMQHANGGYGMYPRYEADSTPKARKITWIDLSKVT